MYRCCNRFFHSVKHQNLVSLLSSCTRVSEISQLHAYMVKASLDLQAFPLSKLLAGSVLDMSYARSLFDQIPSPILYNFNTMLRGYSVSENPKPGLYLFNRLRALGLSLDQFSFITTLKSCARLLAVPSGECIHGLGVRTGFEFITQVRNTLLHFYCECGRTRDAHRLFDESPQSRDMISWNILIGGYLHNSRLDFVMELFRRMHMDGLGLPSVAIVNVLSACGDLKDLLQGESVHAYCIKKCFCLNLNVVTALISMYGKSRFIWYAMRLFDENPDKDVVLWNCIIDIHARVGLLGESVTLFTRMRNTSVQPNSATLVSLLSACASSGALAMGCHIHKWIEYQGLDMDTALCTALIDMYSKCGSIEKAVEVFTQTSNKDVICWTSMINAFGLHGQVEKALDMLYKMEEEGMVPNEVTFLAALSACSHGGLVTEGRKCFKRMVKDYGLSPKIEHFGCMIDLLGRAGLLTEACELIKILPMGTDATGWRAFLAACRVHGNVELGELAKRSLIEMGDWHPANLRLLEGTYTAAGRWEIGRTNNLVEEDPMKKEAGWSFIEAEG